MNAYETKREKINKVLKLFAKLEPKLIKKARLKRDLVDFQDKLAYHQNEVEHYKLRTSEIENQLKEIK